MPKTSTPGQVKLSFRCGECGWESLKWVGRCGECQAWGTVEQLGLPRLRSVAATSVTAAARPIGDIDAEAARSRPTGVDELDRVLGGGLVPGVVVLLAGEPGVGKSTLVLDVASKFAGLDTPDFAGARTLYITGEESTAQVRLRAGRIKALSPHLFLAAETDIGAVLKHVDDVDPALLIVDSVQTMAIADVDGSAGGVTQVRQVAAA
ncbi:MAG TPA: AAA family ATPase, partial [Acidothermaceae bacterium]